MSLQKETHACAITGISQTIRPQVPVKKFASGKRMYLFVKKRAVGRILLLLGSMVPTLALNAQIPASSNLRAAIDWPSFLGRNDMVWEHLPDRWDNAPYTGNGCLGAICWFNKAGALQMEVSRTDLYDHRNNYGKAPILYSRYRLPNGHFELTAAGKPDGGSMRLDLWNAEISGKVSGKEGQWDMRCFTDALSNVIVLEVTGADQPQLTWLPDTAKSTRGGAPKNMVAYPVQVLRQQEDIQVSVQEMPEDTLYNTAGRGMGQYATAWTKYVQRNKTIYLISMGFSYPGRHAVKEAVDLLKQAKARGMTVMEQEHRNWWHVFYPKSFVSVPDAAMESFYWIQLYKMGSLSRSNGAVIDLMGPWFMRTGWPAIWWNLNIQLTYWPFYMSNHLEEAEPLAATLWKNRKALSANAAPYQDDAYAIGRATAPDCLVPVGTEVGNLPWVMHNLWLQYRSTMDDRFLKDRLFPLMKGAFRYLQHVVIRQPDGVWTLPKTASPEYTDAVENCNYTLACLRWLAHTLIEADTRLHAKDPIARDCRELLDKLVPYQQDATGIMVGKDMDFDHSHRHWSHLFMIYPFYEYTWDNAAQALLIKKSLENWLSKPTAFAGYSWLGAASMLAAGNMGDSALSCLQSFLQKSPQPNTLYREGFPVIETPLAFARTLQELLMTSHNNMIRIFPGLPAAWSNACFADLRAEGAFLVSAQRSNGVTQYIRIQSLAGEPCCIKTGMTGIIKVSGIHNTTVNDLGNGIVSIHLSKGETAVLYTGSQVPPVATAPVAVTGKLNAWGENKAPIGKVAAAATPIAMPATPSATTMSDRKEAYWNTGLPLLSWRLPPPPIGFTPKLVDMDKDGDPDLIYTLTRNEIPVLWIDDDDDMQWTDREGDTDNDCLLIDRNKDGRYGAMGDLVIDWVDNDRDNKADMQVIAEYPVERKNDPWPNGHYMWVLDTDHDNVFNYIDWNSFEIKAWDRDGLADFFLDYSGRSAFMKIHVATYTMDKLAMNWENPFLFYDPDNDGLSEMAVRLVETPKTSRTLTVPGEPPYQVKLKGRIDWASIAVDMDNDTGPGNEFDFDMTIGFRGGEGFNYADQVHPLKHMQAQTGTDTFFMDPRWRHLDTLVYADHAHALDLVYHRGKWGQVYFVYDEDDDCNRWERVEFYDPLDPFKAGTGKGGLDNNVQSDIAGDRGEWDLDNSGNGKLYVSKLDGRIHLYGAEWGAWRIDQNATLYQGWDRKFLNKEAGRFATVKYVDTDNNGFIDKMLYDLNGDAVFEDSVELKKLDLDDRSALTDPATYQYKDYVKLHQKVADGMWAQAQQALKVAQQHGLNTSWYAKWMQAASASQQYRNGYWLQFYIYRDLKDLFQRLQQIHSMKLLEKAYYGGDWSLLINR